MLRHPCILGGPQHQARGTKSEVVASPLPSRGPKRRRKCYFTPAFLGIANANCSEQNQKWPHTKGNKITSGCLTPAFSGGQKRAEMLHHPCILGDPQRQARGAKSEVAPNKGEQNQKWLSHPCLLGGPKRGRKCYVAPAFSGVPYKGEQNQKWLSHLYLLGGPKRGAQCYVTPAFSGIPHAKCRGKIRKGCLTLALLRAQKEGGNATPPLHSRGSPTPSTGSKIRSGYLTSAFWRAQKRAEMLRHPCILGDPQ